MGIFVCDICQKAWVDNISCECSQHIPVPLYRPSQPAIRGGDRNSRLQEIARLLQENPEAFEEMQMQMMGIMD